MLVDLVEERAGIGATAEQWDGRGEHAVELHLHPVRLVDDHQVAASAGEFEVTDALRVLWVRDTGIHQAGRGGYPDPRVDQGPWPVMARALGPERTGSPVRGPRVVGVHLAFLGRLEPGTRCFAESQEVVGGVAVGVAQRVQSTGGAQVLEAGVQVGEQVGFAASCGPSVEPFGVLLTARRAEDGCGGGGNVGVVELDQFELLRDVADHHRHVPSLPGEVHGQDVPKRALAGSDDPEQVLDAGHGEVAGGTEASAAACGQPDRLEAGEPVGRFPGVHGRSRDHQLLPREGQRPARMDRKPSEVVTGRSGG